MKIGQRLALRFTLVSALLTGMILIFIYTLTEGFVHSDFEERLARQSRLEVLHFTSPDVKEVIPPETFLIENPQTSIYSEDGTLLHTQGDFPVSPQWLAYMQAHPAFTARRDSYTTVGRKFNIKGKNYIVFVADQDLAGENELEILQKTTVTGWGLSIVLSFLAGLYFSSNALQPVKRVVAEVNQITKDNLSYRLQNEVSGNKQPDEIDELIITFNALLTRIESAFVAQRRFVQNASHELKTPLTSILAEAELALAKDRSTSEYQRTLDVVVSETERLVNITQGLLTLARLEDGFLADNVMETIPLRNLVDSTIKSFSIHHPQRKVNVTENDASLSVHGNEQLLQLALLNVLDNAVKYSTADIDLYTAQRDEMIVISIRDRGIGIPAAELARVRAPLYRASNARTKQGAGLGLSLVERIVTVHNGALELTSEEAKGTVCSVLIPAGQ